MDIERIVVRLVADTAAYIDGMSRAEARLLYFASFVLEQVGRSAIELASDFERLTIAFEVMTGSAQTGLDVLNKITQLAIESPFTSAELIQAGKQVKAFGFDTNDIIPVLARLGDVSVATGTDINRIILAFGQVRTTGRLMGQELRQFTNAGVPILEYLARAMGTTSAAVPQLVRQGRVGFADVARAFNEMTSTGGLFFGMMERTNLETVWGRWQNVLENVQVLMRNIGLEVITFTGLKATLTDISGWLREINSSDGVKIVRDWVQIIGNVGKMIWNVVTFSTTLWEVVGAIYVTYLSWKVVTGSIWILHGFLVPIMWAYTVAAGVAKMIWSGIFLAVTSVWVVTRAIWLQTVLTNTVLAVIKGTIYAAVVAISVFKTVMFAVTAIVIHWIAAWKLLVGVMVATTVAGKLAVGILLNAMLAVAAIQSAFSAISGLVAFLVTALNPVMVILIGITSAAAVLAYQLFNGGEIWSAVVGTVTSGLTRILRLIQLLLPEFSAAWDGIVMAVKGGDFKLAFEIAFASVKVAWKTLLFHMKGEFTTLAVELDAIIVKRIVHGITTPIRTGLARTMEAIGATGTARKLYEAIAVDEDFAARHHAAARAAVMALRITPEDSAAFARDLPEFAEMLRLTRQAAVVGQVGADVAGEARRLMNERSVPSIQFPGFSEFVGNSFGGMDTVTGLLGPAAVGVANTHQRLVSDFIAEVAKIESYTGRMQTNSKEWIDGVLRVPVQADISKAGVSARAAYAELTRFNEALTGTARAARALINEPLEISAEARKAADQLQRDMEGGIGPLDRFTRGVSLLTEAFAGPLKTPEAFDAFGAAIGPGLFGNVGPKGIGGIIDQETRDFGIYKAYEEFRRSLPNFETMRPTAALAGSREAFDIITRANLQQPSGEDRIRAELATANYIAEAQFAEQQKTTRAIEALRQEGVVVPRIFRKR